MIFRSLSIGYKVCDSGELKGNLMNRNEEFYTLKGYQIQEGGELTTAMEDYLEMICRLTEEEETVRVGELSRRLHVKPSSVTKMLQQLDHTGYIRAEKYGFVHLTEKGREAGRYLLYRHRVIEGFLCVLNRSQDQLEQAEKIEHFLDRQTVENLDVLTGLLKDEKGPWQVLSS